MAKVRCKETAADSFFGNFLYDQKVSREHFLRKLNEVIEWERFTKKLLVHYKGKGQIGQAPYDPVLILKMLLLSYLWNVSERMVEELANDSLSVGLFLGIGANERVPDHSTLTLFKNRLIQNAGMKVYEELFNEIIQVAQEKGVKFGQLQIVDSVHLVADVNITKDRQRQKEGKSPRDKDADWGAKGVKWWRQCTVRNGRQNTSMGTKIRSVSMQRTDWLPVFSRVMPTTMMDTSFRSW